MKCTCYQLQMSLTLKILVSQLSFVGERKFKSPFHMKILQSALDITDKKIRKNVIILGTKNFSDLF